MLTSIVWTALLTAVLAAIFNKIIPTPEKMPKKYHWVGLTAGFVLLVSGVVFVGTAIPAMYIWIWS